MVECRLRWEKMDDGGPCGRAAHSCDRIGDKIYIFGGWNGERALNDLHILDVHTLKWERKDFGNPPARNNHASCVYKSRLYVHGGHDGKNWVNDCYFLDTCAISSESRYLSESSPGRNIEGQRVLGGSMPSCQPLRPNVRSTSSSFHLAHSAFCTGESKTASEDSRANHRDGQDSRRPHRLSARNGFSSHSSAHLSSENESSQVIQIRTSHANQKNEEIADNRNTTVEYTVLETLSHSFSKLTSLTSQTDILNQLYDFARAASLSVESSPVELARGSKEEVRKIKVERHELDGAKIGSQEFGEGDKECAATYEAENGQRKSENNQEYDQNPDQILGYMDANQHNHSESTSGNKTPHAQNPLKNNEFSEPPPFLRPFPLSLDPCNTCVLQWNEVPARKEWPTGRACHSLTCVGQNLYLFGGYDGLSTFENMEVYDISNGEWSQPEVYGARPHPRNGHTMNSYGDVLILFGGHSGYRYFNDVHLFDTRTMSWAGALVEGSCAPSLRGHSATLVYDKLFIFGGYDGYVRSNRLYRLDLGNVGGWYHQMGGIRPIPVVLNENCLAKKKNHVQQDHADLMSIFAKPQGTNTLSPYNYDFSEASPQPRTPTFTFQPQDDNNAWISITPLKTCGISTHSKELRKLPTVPSGGSDSPLATGESCHSDEQLFPPSDHSSPHTDRAEKRRPRKNTPPSHSAITYDSTSINFGSPTQGSREKTPVLQLTLIGDTNSEPRSRQRHTGILIGGGKTKQIFFFGGYNGEQWLKDAYILHVQFLENSFESLVNAAMRQQIKNMRELIHHSDENIEKSYFSDIEIVYNSSKIIKAHRCVLAANSEYFRSLLVGPMMEAKKTQIRVNEENICEEAYMRMLEFIYTGYIDEDLENMRVLIDLLYLSDKYNLANLFVGVQHILANLISISSVCKLTMAAEKYSAKVLSKKCLSFIIQYQADVLDGALLRKSRPLSSRVLEALRLSNTH